MTTDDPDLNELSPTAEKLIKAANKMRLGAMENAWAIVREVEDKTRISLTEQTERDARKVRLLEQITKQLQSIQELVRDIPNDR